MGKKIPKSRRHKKLKFVDPCYSGEVHRTKKKKILPNEPPTQEDYQEAPKQAVELINLKNQANKQKRKKKKKVMKDDFIIVKKDRHDGDIRGSTKGLKKLPNVVKQQRYESTGRFLDRLQKMADTAIAEAKVEEKYNIELVNVDKEGNAQYVAGPKEVGVKKQQKRKKYHEKEVEKKKMKLEEPKFDLQKEKIQFGEVAMAPPIFTAKPRKAPETDKPGKKQLFLKNILEPRNNEETHKSKPLTTKWKNMPSEKRKLIENERSRAVQLYRMMKNKQMNS